MLSKQADFAVVGEAGDGQAALHLAVELQPDVVVADIELPLQSGINVTRRLKQALPQTKVLILSAYDRRDYVQESFQAGASGYLIKRNGVEELFHALRVVCTGDVYLDPAVASKLVGGQTVRRAAQDALSEREAEILTLRAWGYSNKEIAARLNVCVKTVEAQKAAAMAKLDLQSRVDMVRYVVRQGWLNKVE